MRLPVDTSATTLVAMAPPESVVDFASIPARYQVADDLREPIAVVVAAAEREAALGRPEVPDSARRLWRSP